LSRGIRTFTEQQSDRAEIELIKKEIENAETVVFLGFGFIDDNLRLIEPRQTTKINRILATGYGLSESAGFTVQRKVARWARAVNPDIHITKLKCVDLLRDYRMWLSSKD
jgi:hypothetical protein